MKQMNRTVRLNMAFDPQMKESLSTLAKINNTTLNGLINDVLQKYIKANDEVLQKYVSFIDTLNETKTEIDESLFEDN